MITHVILGEDEMRQREEGRGEGEGVGEIHFKKLTHCGGQ